MNKEMTILELFNSYAKPIKQPSKIKYKNKIYAYDGNAVLGQLINEYQDNIIALLNEKVEILEEDKPIIEKLKVKDNKVIGKWGNGSDYRYTLSAPQVVIINKLNEVIDYINRKEDK